MLIAEKLYIVAAAGALATACSSSFDTDCVAKRTCEATTEADGVPGLPDAAPPLEAPDAPDLQAQSTSIDSAPPECTRDSDCAGSDCNAPALCQDGRCAPGSPCENPDPDHCRVDCVKGEGTAECVVSATDRDSDGHGSELCVASPGDDCNDAATTVFPGGEELCDGLDNDCDGLADLDDGLSLGGSPAVVAEVTETGSVGVAPTASGHALLFLRKAAYGPYGDPKELRFTDGEWTVNQQTPVSEIAMLEPVFAGGVSDVVALGQALPNTEPRFEMRKVSDASLRTNALSTEPSSSSAVAWRPGGGWLTAWTQENAGTQVATERGLFARGIATDGALGPTTRLVEPSAAGNYTLVHLAVTDTRTAVVWVEQEVIGEYRFAIRSALFDDALTPQASTPLGTMTSTGQNGVAMVYLLAATRPQVVPVDDRFLIGWFDFEQTLNVAVLSADGAVICGPTVLDGMVGSWSHAHALAPAGSEAVAVIADANRRGQLYRLNARCEQVGEPLTLHEESSELGRGMESQAGYFLVGVGHPAIAAVESGLATAWVERDAVAEGDAGTGASTYRLMARSLGSRLCE